MGKRVSSKSLINCSLKHLDSRCHGNDGCGVDSGLTHMARIVGNNSCPLSLE